MSDEHHHGASGHAGHPIVRTPNLDSLARAGTAFSAAYTPSPICVPARAAWATGLPVRELGCWDNAMGYDGSVPGWGHALQAADVAVESIGKLHYRDAASPTGFDRQIEPMHLAGGLGQVWGSVREPLPVREHTNYLVSWSGPGETDYTRYDARIADHAARWLTERSDQRAPFVLYIGFVAPHFPYIAPPRFYDLYDPSSVPLAKLHPSTGYQRHPWVEAHASVLPDMDAGNTTEERQRCTAAYWGLVSSLDDNIGRILEALDAGGHAEETLVIYTSDHGENLGARGLWGKSVLYEDATRVPLLVRGPDVPAGSWCDTPTSLLDGYRTILDAVRVEGAPRPGIRSWMDLANDGPDPERTIISEYHAFGSPSAGFMIRQGQLKLHHYVGFEPELFDLADDPDELHDRANDPAFALHRARLEHTLLDILDPDDVDRQAKSAQRALVRRVGGIDAALSMGTVAETPAPPG